MIKKNRNKNIKTNFFIFIQILLPQKNLISLISRVILLLMKIMLTNFV